MAATRFLSGVQPSGKLHLGNYFGAIKQHIELQDEPNCLALYFVANYHALTTVRDAERMRMLTRDVVLDYLALGLDPAGREHVALYRQSDVPEVTELTWLLATVTGMGIMERAHSYKDKLAKGITPDAGLFVYPLLMAADILGPRADIVPVGLDQKQHVEMTRDIAGYFNNTYGEVFKVPDYRESPTPRVPGTTYDDKAARDENGKRHPAKMSKSYGNTIDIFAEGKALKKQVMAIETDPKALEDALDPDDCLVFEHYRLFACDDELAEMAEKYRAGGFGYGNAKKALLAKIDERFAPAREKRKELADDPDTIEDILRAGAVRARELIRPTLDAARSACGLA